MKIQKSDILIILAFIAIGLASRTIYHAGPNIELVTALSVTAPFFLKNKKFSLAVPLGIMGLSDLVLGNTIIFTFTWSAFLTSPIIGIIANKLTKKNDRIAILSATGGSLISNIVFFLWTNFGVVVTTSMYDKNLSGLLQSYINAIPFFKNQLITGLVFTPIIFALTAISYKLAQKRFILEQIKLEWLQD